MIKGRLLLVRTDYTLSASLSFRLNVLLDIFSTLNLCCSHLLSVGSGNFALRRRGPLQHYTVRVYTVCVHSIPNTPMYTCFVSVHVGLTLTLSNTGHSVQYLSAEERRKERLVIR